MITFGKCDTHGADFCEHRHPDCYCKSLVESTCDFCRGTRKSPEDRYAAGELSDIGYWILKGHD